MIIICYADSTIHTVSGMTRYIHFTFCTGSYSLFGLKAGFLDDSRVGASCQEVGEGLANTDEDGHKSKSEIVG